MGFFRLRGLEHWKQEAVAESLESLGNACQLIFTSFQLYRAISDSS